MKLLPLRLVYLLLLLPCAVAVNAEPVVEDGGVALTRDELQHVVQGWGRDMRIAAANNPDSRRELLTMAMASKKIARDAQRITVDEDAEFYWSRELQVRGVLRHLMVQHYLDTVELPDLVPLARERYLADKDKYGKVPERRMTSQILFRCAPRECDAEQVKKTANKVLAELDAGGNFEQLAAEYSDDAASKDQGGKFDRWLARGEPHVVPQYTKAAFAIDEVGGYSGLVNSKYGGHIIRLDDIQPAHYKTYEEVAPVIIQQLEQEYKKLAAQEFDRRYAMSDQAVFDDAALDEIFAPYQTFDADAVENETPVVE